jgi:tetratricopeptide (TPR) repeat protein
MELNGASLIALQLSILLLSQGCARGPHQAEMEENRSEASVDAPASSRSIAISPTAGYVKDELCKECHADLYRSYQEVGMANSFYSAGSQEHIEDFENSHYYHAASNQHFEMSLGDGELFQRRYQLNSAGKRYNELEVRVDAIIGSGNHIRCYLYRTPSGEMFQMPLAWYTKTKQWRLNPGYDMAEHQGFQRKITRECMFCHNAYPIDVPAGSDAYWQPAVFPGTLPHGIGCQRCHGPGETHIRLAQSASASLDDVMQAVINPAKLEAGLRDDVCLQCHLQPSSQMLSELVRFNRGDYSFRPGQPIDQYRAFVDYQGDHDQDRFEINHHAYRMRQSACFQESDAALNCLSCHDPHRKVPVPQRVAHYRTACIKCHDVADCGPAFEFEHSLAGQTELDSASKPITASPPKLADCVSCHMAERRTHDAIHATMTDHKIVRTPEPSSQRLAHRAEPPPVSSETLPRQYLLRDSELLDAASEIYGDIAGSQLGNTESVSRLLDFTSSHSTPAPLKALAELASALRNRGDFQLELDTLVRSVQQYPDQVRPNLELAMALAASERHEDALRYYRRALEIGPALPETHVGIGVAMLHRGDLTEATLHFREAVRLRPLYPEALLNLGIVLFAQEEWDAAQQYLLRARAADPAFVEANIYLKQLP